MWSVGPGIATGLGTPRRVACARRISQNSYSSSGRKAKGNGVHLRRVRWQNMTCKVGGDVNTSKGWWKKPDSRTGYRAF